MIDDVRVTVGVTELDAVCSMGTTQRRGRVVTQGVLRRKHPTAVAIEHHRTQQTPEQARSNERAAAHLTGAGGNAGG